MYRAIHHCSQLSVDSACRMNESVGIVHDYVKSLLLSQKVFDLRKQQMFSYPSLSRVSFMDLNTYSCKTPLYTHTVQNNKWSTVCIYFISTPPLHPQETERSKSPFVMNSSLLAFSCFLFLESSGWFLWSTQLTLSLPSFPFIHFFTHWSIIHRYLLNTVHWTQLIPGVTSAKPSVSSWLELTGCCITGLRNTTQPLLIDRSDINPRVCLLLAPRGQIWRVRREGVPGGFTPSSLFMYWPSLLPSFHRVNLCLTLLSSAPLGLLPPELSCPSPPRPRALVALMSASALRPCSWGVSISAYACRFHLPAMSLLRHPGLYAQLVIQNLTHSWCSLHSWNIIIHTCAQINITQACVHVCTTCIY